MAEVYWIRLPEHTDMFSQGYIGVTKNTAMARFRNHLQEAKLRDCKTSHLHNYINKYGREGLIVQTLVVCNINYAYELEGKLRPSERVGWNVAVGGIKAINHGGYLLSTETRQKMSDSFKNGSRKPVSQEVYDRLGDQRRGIPLGPRPKEVVEKILLTRFLKTMESKAEYWSRCEEFYKFYLEGKGKNRACERYYGIKLNRLRGMFNLFEKGWIPTEDENWLRLFKGS